MEEFADRDGNIRRPGSLILPENFVCSFPPYTGDAETPVWEDKDIRRVISDPNRVDITKAIPFEKYGTDQKSTSACNGWAAANALTVRRVLAGIDDGYVASGSYIYSKINGGRDNGSLLRDGMMALEKFGAPDRKLVPYNQIYPKMQAKGVDSEAAKNKGFGCYRLLTKQAMRTALAAGWKVIAAVQADSKFVNFRGEGIAPIANGRANHAVLITDLRLIKGTERYLMDNSWSISWGWKGRCWLVWDHFEQTLDYHAYYAVPAVIRRS